MWEALGWFQCGLHVFYQLLMLHYTSARDITFIHSLFPMPEISSCQAEMPGTMCLGSRTGNY